MCARRLSKGVARLPELGQDRSARMDDPYRSRHRETERKTFGEGDEVDGGSPTPKDTGQVERD